MAAAGGARFKRRKIVTGIRRGQRGVVRVGGFFGRYNRASGGETKFHDLDIDDAVVAAAGAIAEDSCVTIAQGVTESQRIGRKCTVTSINWNYEVVLPTVAGAGPQDGDQVRVILYQDRQANGAAATVTGILETGNYQSFRNLANTGRFRVLMDKTHSINSRAGAGTGAANDWPQVTQTYKYHKRCNIPLEYNSTTGALTELRSNNIGVLLLSSNGLAGFISKMRIRFRG